MPKLTRKEITYEFIKYAGKLAPIKTWRSGFAADPPTAGAMQLDGDLLMVRTHTGEDKWAQNGDFIVRSEWCEYDLVRAEDVKKFTQTAN